MDNLTSNNYPENSKKATNYDDISHELIRIPGLYRRWELREVLKSGFDYLIEEDETTSKGTQLFAVYRRKVPNLIVLDG